MEYYEFRAMNSNIVLAAEGDDETLDKGFERARALIEASEARFTRFFETSELSALNRAAGEWISVSPELYVVTREACVFVDETGGLFDPSTLDALERAGYDQSMDEIRRVGASAMRESESSRPVDIRAVQFDAARSAIRLPRGLRLDLGGIAKGWIAERAARARSARAGTCF